MPRKNEIVWMCDVARRFCLAGLTALFVAGCGTSRPQMGAPPGKQQVTLHVKEMSQRLKLM
jgi:hypothetical protein